MKFPVNDLFYDYLVGEEMGKGFLESPQSADADWWYCKDFQFWIPRSPRMLVWFREPGEYQARCFPFKRTINDKR
jgi:hypothetical protein